VILTLLGSEDGERIGHSCTNVNVDNVGLISVQMILSNSFCSLLHLDDLVLGSLKNLLDEVGVLDVALEILAGVGAGDELVNLAV